MIPTAGYRPAEHCKIVCSRFTCLYSGGHCNAEHCVIVCFRLTCGYSGGPYKAEHLSTMHPLTVQISYPELLGGKKSHGGAWLFRVKCCRDGEVYNRAGVRAADAKLPASGQQVSQSDAFQAQRSPVPCTQRSAGDPFSAITQVKLYVRF
jgi:hypothetical protein